MLPGFLRRAIVENAALKAVSFALALTLFILVRGEKETERAVRVGVAYIRPADRVLVNEVPDGVDVWVRGPWTKIKRLDPTDVDPIVIDLSRATDGELTLEASMLHVPSGLHIVSFRPPKLTLQFEHIKRLPVVAEPVGALPEGYVVERIIVEPPVVVVRGPRAPIEGMTEIRTLPLSISGKRSAFRESVALPPLPRGVTAEVESVAVDVQILEETISRTLANHPIRLDAPAGVKVPPMMTVSPTAADVTLRGGHAAMKRVDTRKIAVTVEVRLEDFAPGRSRQAKLQVDGVPEGVAVEVHPSDVTLTTGLPPGK